MIYLLFLFNYLSNLFLIFQYFYLNIQHKTYSFIIQHLKLFTSYISLSIFYIYHFMKIIYTDETKTIPEI
jgi:hypothetical protein